MIPHFVRKGNFIIRVEGSSRVEGVNGFEAQRQNFSRSYPQRGRLAPNCALQEQKNQVRKRVSSGFSR